MPAFETPQDCFDAHIAAAVAKDYAAFLDCFTPASQAQQTGLKAVELRQLAVDDDEEAVALVDALFERHNLADVDIALIMQREVSPRGVVNASALHVIGAEVVDKPAFHADVDELTGEDFASADIIYDVRLAEIGIDGDCATGKAVMNGAPEESVVFRKVEGSWLLATPNDTEYANPPKYSRARHHAMQKLWGKGHFKIDYETDGWPIKHFYFISKKLTNDDLDALRDVPQIRSISFDKANITDESLKYLKPLTMLESVNLRDTRITDESMRYLTPLVMLKSLDLRGTKISDAGLPRLYSHKSLSRLDLRDAPVTEEGLKLLRQALPDCEIESGYRLRWNSGINVDEVAEVVQRGYTLLVYVRDGNEDRSFTFADEVLNCREVYDWTVENNVLNVPVEAEYLDELPSWLPEWSPRQIAVFSPRNLQPRLLDEGATTKQVIDALRAAGPSKP